MTDKYQTQCPHCGVKFQITDQQLALAKGNVRCGSCLQVFQASQHLVPLAATPPPSGMGTARPSAMPSAVAAPRPAAPPRPADIPPRPARQTDDDLADMILRELEEPAVPKPVPTSHQPATPAPATDSMQKAAAEPQWELPGKPEPAAEPRLFLGGELDDELISDDDPFGAGTGGHGSKREDSAGADESWTRALMGEDNAEDERVRKFVALTADKLSLAERTGVQARSDLERRLNAIAGEGKGADQEEDDEFGFLNDRGMTTRELDLAAGSGDSLSVAVTTHEVAWGRNVVWGTLSALFLLLLGVQYLVYNFDTLARDDSWRGLYATACDALGCSLPESSDIARIEGANLVVRSHPSIAEALVVDALVYNRAPFGQPFPRLELTFTDVLGNTLAGRVFEPTEYLGGELSATDDMPPDTPIHLTIELVDPGPQAVGYGMRFLPPASS